MDTATTAINATLTERVELIMVNASNEDRQWRLPLPASVATADKRSFLGNQDVDASTLVMGGHYAIDDTFPTRWGSRPDRPPV